MLISKTCSYAIRATLYLAVQPPGKYIPIREISDKLGISFHFLTKILQTLTARNILLSYRGPNGGITLARHASQIHLSEIIEAVDGESIFKVCVIGLEGCSDESPCPLHVQWAVEREKLRNLFKSMTLQKLVDGTDSDKIRLTDIHHGESAENA